MLYMPKPLPEISEHSYNKLLAFTMITTSLKRWT